MRLIKKIQQTLLVLILAQFLFLSNTDVFGSDKDRNHYMDARTAKGLQEIFHYNGKSLPFLSSHRGGPEKNMPENCIATFKYLKAHVFHHGNRPKVYQRQYDDSTPRSDLKPDNNRQWQSY